MLDKAAKARALYREGRFEEAQALYRELAYEYPVLAATYDPEILASPDKASEVEDKFVYLDDLHAQVSKAADKIDWDALLDKPRVSVIMTAYNAERFIEAAVTSVVRQTWRNLELIVVDDFSTDGTPEILLRLARNHRNVHYVRLNANLGTYYAKNVGIKKAKGKYVFFHDSDDICHPYRIALSMWHLLQDEEAVAVRGVTSRVVYPSGRVLPVSGRMARPGYITLGIERSMFEAIGYFNCTTKASDDEFINRLGVYLKAEGGKLVEVDYPSYYLTYRDDSLSADMIKNDPTKDGKIVRQNSLSRARYKEVFNELHANQPVKSFKDIFRFPVVRDPLPCPADMTKLANPADLVVASLCSIPQRWDQLERTLESIEHQVDCIYLYLDNYDHTPGFVYDLACEVHVTHSRDVPGLRDNGKFLPLQIINKPCYFFTMDDDIVYPPDYVNAMVKKLNFYEQAVVLGVHGVLLPDDAQRYFSGYRKVYHFGRALEKDVLVSNLGTGTVAFHTRYFGELSVNDFSETGMSDIYFSIFCKKRRIPMVCVSRPASWLLELMPDNEASLFHEFKRADDKQSELIAENRPWGVPGMSSAIEGASGRISDPQALRVLENMVPILNKYML